MPTLYKSPEATFDYDDVMLLPEECVVKSRSEIDVTTRLGGNTFTLPIIPANMSTIVNEETCEWLAERGYFYVMHRFDIDAVEFTKRMQKQNYPASISLGIKQVDYDTVERFVKENITPEYITVDVAHGDNGEVHRIVKFLKEKLPQSFVIAGNLASVEGAKRMVEAGADAIKVGVGPGAACLTGPNTGFGSRGWQLSALADIAEALMDTDIKIIADGGIRKYGDFAKSIAFGADMVMVGGMFASHSESPGEIIDDNGVLKKEFFGSASEYQKGETKHVEGLKMLVPYKGSLETTFQTIKENLQSSVSYAGGKSLEDLRHVQYVVIK